MQIVLRWFEIRQFMKGKQRPYINSQTHTVVILTYPHKQSKITESPKCIVPFVTLSKLTNRHSFISMGRSPRRLGIHITRWRGFVTGKKPKRWYRNDLGEWSRSSLWLPAWECSPLTAPWTHRCRWSRSLLVRTLPPGPPPRGSTDPQLVWREREKKFNWKKPRTC